MNLPSLFVLHCAKQHPSPAFSGVVPDHHIHSFERPTSISRVILVAAAVKMPSGKTPLLGVRVNVRVLVPRMCEVRFHLQNCECLRTHNHAALRDQPPANLAQSCPHHRKLGVWPRHIPQIHGARAGRGRWPWRGCYHGRGLSRRHWGSSCLGGLGNCLPLGAGLGLGDCHGLRGSLGLGGNHRLGFGLRLWSHNCSCKLGS
mmetsp:Transcript_106154/g.243031  ORF Transcript_106154/g.243031 Transcript_106154/m.243031 type:complete len:202 (-) Transcript_106154:7-612(-)